MIQCKICEINLKNNYALSCHLRFKHKNYSGKKYYDEFIQETSSKCICGKEKKFRNIGEGYREYCSPQCRSNHIKPTNYWEGKNQPEDLIRKRINNTNQKSKEEKRKATMIKKYGVNNPSQLDDFKEKIWSPNRKRNIKPRTKEHCEKIINSKRKNNTLKHSISTRSKITKSLEEYYKNGNEQSVNLSKTQASNGRGHKVGFHNGILYRSSYEFLFIIFCEKYGIKINSCENKERRVRYEYNNKKHWYYPDFYLPEHEICIEIKPKSRMTELFYVKKDYAERVYKNFKVITEDHISNFDKMYKFLFEKAIDK